MLVSMDLIEVSVHVNDAKGITDVPLSINTGFQIKNRQFLEFWWTILGVFRKSWEQCCLGFFNDDSATVQKVSTP